MAYRVFLSSTFTDLLQYRKTVQEAIRQLGVIDVSMEHFGARDERPTDECVRLVSKESDIFVGIYAYRYGYIPDGSDVSISEIEYRAASEAALPRFIYVLDQNQPWLFTQMDTGENSKKLEAFKQALFKRHICQTFEGKDNLATKVVADLGRYIALQRTPAIGSGPAIPVPDIQFDSAYVPADPEVETSRAWSSQRNGIYRGNREIFLTHIIHPSSKPGQQFKVFIYLIRHQSENFADVAGAEFFLGEYWGNKVFPAEERDGFIGISTEAYGTFLCICRVTFRDGTWIDLDRYIDFEMYRTGGS